MPNVIVFCFKKVTDQVIGDKGGSGNAKAESGEETSNYMLYYIDSGDLMELALPAAKYM